MAQILEHTANKEDWYKITLYRLIEVQQAFRQQIHPFQGAKGPAAGICLCDRGAYDRKGGYPG